MLFKTNYHLMQVECIAECSKRSILQYLGAFCNTIYWPYLLNLKRKQKKLQWYVLRTQNVCFNRKWKIVYRYSESNVSKYWAHRTIVVLHKFIRRGKVTIKGRAVLSSYRGYQEVWAGADPGFLERGFICTKGWWTRFANFISFFINISLRPNYFIFIRNIKTGGGGGSSERPEPPLDSAHVETSHRRIIRVLKDINRKTQTSQATGI